MFRHFVDINNRLYCSLEDEHQAVMKSLDHAPNASSIVAGARFPGSTSNMLNSLRGIFVNTSVNFGSFVEGSNNHCIQLFRPGELNATTTIGGSGLPTPITGLFSQLEFF